MARRYSLDGQPIGEESQVQSPGGLSDGSDSLVFYDLAGNKIANRPRLTEAQKVNLQDTSSVMPQDKPETIDYFRRYFGRFVPGALSALGSPAFTAVSSLAGAGGGGLITKGLATMLGSLGGHELRQNYPRAFGAPSESPISDSVLEAATFGAIDKGVGLIKGAFPSVRQQWMKEWLNKHFPNLSTAADTAAYRAGAKDLTVPQATANRNSIYAKLMNPDIETKIATKQAAEDVATAQSIVTPQTTEQVVTGAQKTARALQATLKNEKNTLYENAINEAEKTTVDAFELQHFKHSGAGFAGLKPGGYKKVPVNIKAPVKLDTSKDFAQEVKDSLKEAIESDPTYGTSPETQGALQRILKEMESITSEKVMYDSKTFAPIKDKVLPLAKVKAIRDMLDEQMESARFTTNPKRLQAAFSTLKNLLSKDINASAVNWGPVAETAWKDAQSKYIEYANKIFPEMAQKLLRAGTDPDTTFQMVAREAVTDPLKARQLVAVAGREPARDIYFKKLIEDNMGKDAFDVNRALVQMQRDKELMLEFTNHPERSAVERFFRVASMRGVGGGSNLHTAIQFAEGRSAINVGAGALSLASQGMVPQSAKAGGVLFAVITPIQNFVTKILVNPKYARLATEAVGNRVDSPVSRLVGQGLLIALKGETVNLRAPDGKTYPARINKDGKVEIIRSFK